MNQSQVKSINIRQTGKKALDLFNPETIARINHLKSQKKKRAQLRASPEHYLNNIYSLDSSIKNSQYYPKQLIARHRVSPKKIRKPTLNLDVPSVHPIANVTQPNMTSMPHHNYHYTSSRASKKSPKKYDTKVGNRPNYTTSNNMVSNITANNIINNTIANNNRPNNIIANNNVANTIANTISNNMDIDKRTSPFEFINVPRRNHSPKTVWRLVRRQSRNKRKFKQEEQQPRHTDHRSIAIPKAITKEITRVVNFNDPKRNISRQKRDTKAIKSIKNKNTKLHDKKQYPKTKSKSKLLLLDRKSDVKKRFLQRKTIRNRVKKWNHKKIVFYLARRGIVRLDTKAPLELLKDLYLTCRAMGNVYIERISK